MRADVVDAVISHTAGCGILVLSNISTVISLSLLNSALSHHSLPGCQCVTVAGQVLPPCEYELHFCLCHAAIATTDLSLTLGD